MTENPSITQICPHCGATNIGIQTTCLKCGKALAVEKPSFAPPQEDKTVLEKPNPLDAHTVKEAEPPTPKALLYESKSGTGMQYVLTDGFTLGRGTNNNVVIDSSKASRSHARIDFKAPADWQISDLGSTNGTFLNGNQIDSPAALKDGDIIRIGEVEFTLKLESPRKPEMKAPQAVPLPPPPVSQVPPPASKPIRTPAQSTPNQIKSASSTKTLVLIGAGLLLLVICLCVGALLIYNYVIR